MVVADEAARGVTVGGEVRQRGRHGPRGEGDVGARAAVPAGGAAPLRVGRAGGAVRAVRLQAAAHLRRLGARALGATRRRTRRRRRHPWMAKSTTGKFNKPSAS